MSKILVEMGLIRGCRCLKWLQEIKIREGYYYFLPLTFIEWGRSSNTENCHQYSQLPGAWKKIILWKMPKVIKKFVTHILACYFKGTIMWLYVSFNSKFCVSSSHWQNLTQNATSKIHGNVAPSLLAPMMQKNDRIESITTWQKTMCFSRTLCSSSQTLL